MNLALTVSISDGSSAGTRVRVVYNWKRIWTFIENTFVSVFSGGALSGAARIQWLTKIRRCKTRSGFDRRRLGTAARVHRAAYLRGSWKECFREHGGKGETLKFRRLLINCRRARVSLRALTDRPRFKRGYLFIFLSLEPMRAELFHPVVLKNRAAASFGNIVLRFDEFQWKISLVACQDGILSVSKDRQFWKVVRLRC